MRSNQRDRRSSVSAVAPSLDLTREQAISFASAAKLPELQRDGRPIHTSTIFRWGTRGCHGIKLEIARAGSRLVTSREAIGRFLSKLSGAVVTGDPSAALPSGHRQAEAELLAAGA